jgi:hypothetical protein
MKNIREQVKAIIEPFVRMCTYFKVGAIRSKGENSQLECVGLLHCDYPNDVNKHLLVGRPHSFILALDPFNFL